jgi:hypothetical protein
VVNSIARCDNSRSVSAILNSGLREILRPDGIVIWVLEGYYANEVRLNPIAQHGECGGQSFARELLSMRRVKTKRKDCVEPFKFSFGLPWQGTSRAIGAIELSYARDVTEDCEKIIERVAGSLAIVAASKFCRVN